MSGPVVRIVDLRPKVAGSRPARPCELAFVIWTACKIMHNQYATSCGFRPHPRECIYASGSIISLSISQITNTNGSKRHSLQAVELLQWFQAAVQIVSNLPAPSNGGPIYRFLGMPAMRTRWMAGAAAHKSG